MICLDSNVIIYYLQGTPEGGTDPKTTSLIQRAEKYVRVGLVQRETFLIPVPAVSEILTGYDEQLWPQVLEQLQTAFILSPMNLEAARYAAQAMQQLKSVRQAGSTTHKQSLKIDALVIGIALSFGATEIITADVSDYQGLAAAFPQIKISDIPNVVEQPSLLDDEESKN